MNPSVLSFGFGGVLILVGLLGGGFEVKELKIPKVGAGARILSSFVGLVFVCFGLAGSSNMPGAPPQAAASAASSADQPAEFTLTDELGYGQVSEQVMVLLDGKSIGNLTVDAAYPHASMKVVTAPGPHSYTAESTAIFLYGNSTVRYIGAGQGTINVQNGKVYSLRGSITGNTWFVSIEQED